MNRRIILAAVVFVILVALLLSSTFTVSLWQTAIVLRFGDPRRVVTDAGLHFRVPLIENVVELDKRVLNFDAPSDEIITTDLRRILISAFVRYQILEPQTFYQVGRTTDNAENQFRNVLESTLRDKIGDVPMANILTSQRADLMREITGQMNDKLASAYGIKIIDVRFKRVDLPPENVEKVFDSMRAERAQEAAAIRATGDAEARNIRAQADKDYTIKLAEAQRYASTVHGAGDGDATRIYNEAFGKDPAFFDFFRSMQALREGLGSDTTTYVGSPTGDFFRFFGHDGEGAKPVGSAGTANPSVE